MVIGEIIDYVAMENFRIYMRVFSILVMLFLKQSMIYSDLHVYVCTTVYPCDWNPTFWLAEQPPSPRGGIDIRNF